MKRDPTEIWDDDLLDRKQDAAFLYNFLVGQNRQRQEGKRKGSYVVNLDSDWGGGKTFFLERFAEDVRSRGHIVVEVNAWRDDHSEDPYVAIMSAIEREFSPYFSKRTRLKQAWDLTKKSGGRVAVRGGGAVFKALFKKYVGLGLDELVELVGEVDSRTDEGDVDGLIAEASALAGDELEGLFDNYLEHIIQMFNQTNASQVDFRAKLGAAVKTLSGRIEPPLFIIVDELDRCRPTYAVQLLERVKHLFDVPNVIFVFGTNVDQLKHSIAGAYGAQFDGFRYLKRFFDRTYVFDVPSTRDLIESYCKEIPPEKIKAPREGLVEVLSKGFDAFGMDLRSIEHIMDIILATAIAWPHKPRIEIALLFPLCVNFYRTGKANWISTDDKSLAKWDFTSIDLDRKGKQTIRGVHLGNAYASAVHALQKLSRAMDLGRNTSNPTQRYVSGIFEPEWNGMPADTEAPSIQAELPSLVANAGRISSFSASSHE